MAVGITSLLDWPMFTWSFGCTEVFPLSISAALLAITSFVFMLVEVPEPV